MNKVETVAQWSIAVIAGVAMLFVTVMGTGLGISLYRYGIYDGSQMKCLYHATNVDDIHECAKQPLP